MDTEQRLEFLCQIIRDYEIVQYITKNRSEFEDSSSLKPCETGADIALLDAIVHKIGLHPVNYEMAMMRARERLGLLERQDEDGGRIAMDGAALSEGEAES